jgi:preprotein translocase subunit YajC
MLSPAKKRNAIMLGLALGFVIVIFYFVYWRLAAR